MLSGSLSVEFFAYIHDVILFNVQLRNKCDDDVVEYCSYIINHIATEVCP